MRICGVLSEGKKGFIDLILRAGIEPATSHLLGGRSRPTELTELCGFVCMCVCVVCRVSCVVCRVCYGWIGLAHPRVSLDNQREQMLFPG